MGWAFQTLNNEMLQVSEDIARCKEMIQIEKDTIAEMERRHDKHLESAKDDLQNS